MEPEGSIPNSQELSTCSYPQPDQSSPQYPIPTLQDLTFQVPNLISVFHSLGRLSKESVQVRGSLEVFVTSFFFAVRGVNPTPNPQAGRPPLVICPRLLIQYIRS
jgi:hypothetical protein